MTWELTEHMSDVSLLEPPCSVLPTMVTNNTQRHTGMYLSLLPNAQCKSEQVKGNASSTHISDYHCHQRPGTGYLETISNHKPTNKSKLQALKHTLGCKVHTVNIEIYFYANSSNRCCSVITK